MTDFFSVPTFLFPREKEKEPERGGERKSVWERERGERGRERGGERCGRERGRKRGWKRGRRRVMREGE